jgi:cytochrome P450
MPPAVETPRALQTLRLSMRQAHFVFRARRELGDVFVFRGVVDSEAVVFTCRPEDVKALMTAKPDQAPSLTAESPLRPIVGPNSVLTALGAQHMRQRKLLLPPFHGEAVERYVEMIEQAADREIDSWPVGEPFALAPAMQKITLDVIMSGIFGIEGVAPKGTPERNLRDAIRTITKLSTTRVAQLSELIQIGGEEPRGMLKAIIAYLDRAMYAVIEARRGQTGGTDILSLLLQARGEDGEPMTDHELRDELVSLVLAGHETTANSLSWAFERLVRTPPAYERLKSDPTDTEYVEATIHETMRVRPVIPIIGRRVKVPWAMGDYRLPADTPVLVSILLLHHREDVYPEPFTFQPERFLGVKPGTYTWMPFGGGIRRCLGAALAMAEQRVVLSKVAARTDMIAADPKPERVRHRNVTMIPEHGARVVVTAKR